MAVYQPVPILADKMSYWKWQDEGNCVTNPSDVFFTDETIRGKERRIREVTAKKICRQCPVIEKCLSHALVTPEVYGVWGGLTEKERMRMSRDLRRSQGRP